MKTSRLAAACALSLALCAAGVSSAHADLAYGADPFQNRVFAIDLTTGTLSNGVPVSLAGFTPTGTTALTAHPATQVVYGIVKTVTGQGGRKLCTIDPVTGTATLIGAVPNGVSSLTFNSAGVLYAMTGQGGTPASTLYTLSTVDATATVVFGPITAGADGEVIAFGPGDVLYHSSGNGTANFSIINLGPNTTTLLGSESGEMFGMGYQSSTSTMYCTNINSQLLRVNLTNGARTVVGPTDLGIDSIDVRGLAIITTGGACCTAGACTIVSSGTCTGGGGVFVDGVCSPGLCTLGACCSGAACASSTSMSCTGTFLGGGSTCSVTVLGGSINACCPADFNNSGAVSVQDIFDFLAKYFVGCP